MTIQDLIDSIPDWIKRVEKLKGFSGTLISRGWDWDHLYINGDNAIKLLFEYHYEDGKVILAEAKMANCVFQSKPIELDKPGHIPTESLKSDELIKIRLMYIIFQIHKCFQTNLLLKKNPDNKLILEVENDGSINIRA